MFCLLKAIRNARRNIYSGRPFATSQIEIPPPIKILPPIVEKHAMKKSYWSTPITRTIPGHLQQRPAHQVIPGRPN